MPEWNTSADEPARFKDLEVVFANILNVAVVLAGLTLFVMMATGAINYLKSGGDPEKVKKAQGTLTWAIVGFLLLIGSWFILRFLSEFTGVDLTKFELPGSP
jgi:hypothetical protein